MRYRRSVQGERGALALELAVGIGFIAVVWAVSLGLAWGAGRLGWAAVGRLLGMTPIWFVGLANFWIAWRPSDHHEAKAMARLSGVVRGLGMVVPPVVFAASPEAMPFGWFMGILLGGMALSFVVLSLPWTPSRKAQ